MPALQLLILKKVLNSCQSCLKMIWRLHIHFLFHLIKLEILNIMMGIFELQDRTIFNH
uniref:Uncharacterized protein n=1 Tax=Lotus japonicus TaxID=34305 RepID=I3RZL2_LOTJA|nr:unknown [Lotus japonicus]